ncbi:hypothetical protein JAAARDRAFT_34950 [Jaapia argillacea MUCL 33604]|uniref:Protein kinase domain-containing protein n=1 Tax=Jaapia argillacea MUCL 33604 TaxID=933084 RepID=A0A067PTJ2_9AGAM|nr:hypothetical protein JAAARDRAFT_34950 [Jaapia argillacea MUCL 33604]
MEAKTHDFPFAVGEHANLYLVTEGGRQMVRKKMRLPAEIIVESGMRLFERAKNAGSISSYISPINSVSCDERAILDVTLPFYQNGHICAYLNGAPNNEKMKMLIKFAQAVENIHHLLGPHGHIVPGNVMVKDDHNIVITDYRVSATLNEIFPGQIPSSWMFRATEVFSGNNDAFTAPTRPDDVFGFAGVMYQVLTGKPPFSPNNYYSRVILGDGELALIDRSGLGTEMWDLLIQCFSPQPFTRPTMGDIVVRLKIMAELY